MTEKNQDAERDLDRALDAALAKYAAVEPRAGLEERILTKLRAQPAHSHQAWWAWGLAAALAVIVILAVALASRPRSTPTPVVVEQQSVPVPVPPKSPVVVGANRAPAMPPNHRPIRRATEGNVVSNPKLDVFPSPQPLSAEEIALTHYVKDFPNDAQLVAQAQEEFELEVQKEMNDTGSEPRN